MTNQAFHKHHVQTIKPNIEVCIDNNHRWIVFSTALKEGWLMLNCETCSAMGTVDSPSKKEWSDAFHSPTRPYRWHDNSRVTLRSVGPTYVCPYDNVIKGKIIAPREPLSESDAGNLKALAEDVIRLQLDGWLMASGIYQFVCSADVALSAPVKHLVGQIGRLVARGRVFTPGMLAIVIREYLQEAPTQANLINGMNNSK